MTAILAVVFLPVIIGRQNFFSAISGVTLESGPYGFNSLKTPWTLDPGAYMFYEVPQTVFWYQELRKGIFPFWNPYQGAGQPLSGALLSGIYHPLKLLLFGAFPYLKTFDFYILARLLIAGFGSFLFLRKIAVSKNSALLGAVAYMFSGYFMNWITHWSLAADMMTSYILFAIEKLFESPRLRNVFLLGSFTALMVLSNNPEAVIMIVLFAVLYFLFKFFNAAEKRPLYLRGFLLGMLIAFLLSLPMLWDTVLFFSQALNAHAKELVPAGGFHEPFSLRLSRVLQIFVSPSMFLEIGRMGGLYQNGYFPMPYAGTFVLLLAVSALSVKRGEHYNPAVIFFGGYVIFFLLKLVNVVPFDWLSRLPVLDKVIFLKYSGTLYFSLAALAAFGFENLKNKKVDQRIFYKIVAAIILFISAAAFVSPVFRGAYTLSFDEEGLKTINDQIAKLPPSLAVAASYLINHPSFYAYLISALTIFWLILFLLAWKSGKTALIFCLVILELILYIPKIRDGGFKPFDPYKEPPFVQFLKSKPDINYYRIAATGKTFFPQTASVYNLQDIRTIDTVYLRRYLNFGDSVVGKEFSKNIISNWNVAFEIDQINDRLGRFFNLTGVKYIISEKPLGENADYKLIYDKEVKIYENPDALPRAYLIAGGQILKTAQIIDSQPNSVTIEVNAPGPSTLILADSFYPGWRVFTDGREETIFPVDFLFRGVKVNSGRHRVIFKYNPFYFGK